MTYLSQNDEVLYECDICGEVLYDPDDCRMIDGYIMCLECIREMSTAELAEITGIPTEDEICELIGLVRPKYDVEEEWYV